MANLSPRAAQALDVLGNGGAFFHGLERNQYTGQDQFHWRLKTKDGDTIPGIGVATFRELQKQGYEFRREAPWAVGSAEYFHLGVPTKLHGMPIKKRD